MRSATGVLSSSPGGRTDAPPASPPGTRGRSAATPRDRRGTTTSPSPRASTSTATRWSRSTRSKGTATRSSSKVSQRWPRIAPPVQRCSRRRWNTSGLSSSPGNSSALSIRPCSRTYAWSPRAAIAWASASVCAGAAARRRPIRQPSPDRRSSSHPASARRRPTTTRSGPVTRVARGRGHVRGAGQAPTLGGAAGRQRPEGTVHATWAVMRS